MAKFEKGKVFDVNEMIDYADGGVISKELIHNDSGSVTLFSFDAGQGLSEHSAPYDALIQVIDGEMELTVEGQKNVIKAGEAFVIPSGARHSVSCHANESKESSLSLPSAADDAKKGGAAKRFKMMITMIRG